MYKTDISVKIKSLKMKNPVMPASGAYDYFEDNANVFPMNTLGAIMLKSINRRERFGNPPPRIAEITAGMMNSVGIPSVGIDKFLSENQPKKYAVLDVPVIISISGNSPEDYVEICQKLEGNPYLAAIEMNLSCPNVGTGLQLASDEVLLGRTVQACRHMSSFPLIIKLSPNVTHINKLAQIAEECGADALTIANTYMGLKIDIKKRKPWLGNTTGGVSGPAIKPLTLYHVFQAYRAVTIPIIGCGGIMGWEDAVEYFMAGASAVQVGAGNFVNPMLMKEVIDGIDNYLDKNGFKSLQDIIGIANQKNPGTDCGCNL